MNLYLGAILLTITGNVAYHVLNKSVAPNAHPFASLVVTYAIALAGSLAILAFDTRAGVGTALGGVNWASYVLGIAVVSLELGFLLAYRAGWALSLAAVYSNVAVGMLLLPVGILLYRESLNSANLAGLVLALISLLLMTR